jgi:small redox-active disulfide protein 2
MSEKKGMFGGLFNSGKKGCCDMEIIEEAESCCLPGDAPARKESACCCPGGVCPPGAEDDKPEAKPARITIKVLGSGCAKCNALEENVRAAIIGRETDYEVIKVTDVMDIAAHGVMVTPALMIGKRIVSTGKVLKPEEIKELLKKYK